MTDGPDRTDRDEAPETLAEVLASIRALVSAETIARVEAATADVVVLTPAMRIDAASPLRAGDLLADGIEPRARLVSAPNFDEDALRGMINAIVREELQGELGDRISRNLRKLVRREIAQMLDDEREGSTGPSDATPGVN